MVSMKELSEWEDIIITKANEGDTVVIAAVKDCIKVAERQLNNIKNYRKFQEDPPATNMKLVNDTTERLKENNEWKSCWGPEKKWCKKTKFYLWLKIQKEGNPGDLVVNSVNCHTANISKYVDSHLQTIVKEIP